MPIKISKSVSSSKFINSLFVLTFLIFSLSLSIPTQAATYRVGCPKNNTIMLGTFINNYDTGYININVWASTTRYESGGYANTTKPPANLFTMSQISSICSNLSATRSGVYVAYHPWPLTEAVSNGIGGDMEYCLLYPLYRCARVSTARHQYLKNKPQSPGAFNFLCLENTNILSDTTNWHWDAPITNFSLSDYNGASTNCDNSGYKNFIFYDPS